jgi:anti-sigma28 factor (negative regulator of flagellin synthesis)
MSNQFETPRSANDNETIKKKILNGKIQMKTSHIKRKILFRAYNNRVAIGTTHMGEERF